MFVCLFVCLFVCIFLLGVVNRVFNLEERVNKTNCVLNTSEDEHT